jgi:hypothetical protein
MAVIATPLPEMLSAAIRSGDEPQIESALAEWDPVVPIAFDGDNVEGTIKEFAKVVDQIEDHEFDPPKVSLLAERADRRGTFATRICRNCDARFSCSSYREYAKKHKDRNWTKFANFYDLEADEEESLARFVATTPDQTDLATADDED